MIAGLFWEREGQVALGEWLVQKTQERLEKYEIGVELQQANVAHLFAPSQVKETFERSKDGSYKPREQRLN